MEGGPQQGHFSFPWKGEIFLCKPWPQGSSGPEKGINSGQHSARFVCIRSLLSCFLLASTLLISHKGLGAWEWLIRY